MDDLVQFLRDRDDEDERAARSAKAGPWHADGGSVYATHPTDEVVTYTESAAHIARHDPARVLAEVEAKRRIVREWEGAKSAAEADPTDASARVAQLAFEIALRALGLPYAEHEAYRKEWRP